MAYSKYNEMQTPTYLLPIRKQLRKNMNSMVVTFGGLFLILTTVGYFSADIGPIDELIFMLLYLVASISVMLVGCAIGVLAGFDICTKELLKYLEKQ